MLGKRNITILLLSLMSLGEISSQSFSDVTESSGINHQFKVYEGMFGGGALVFDYNNDGFEDLYLTSGMNEDVLYKNNGDGTFTDVYENSGLEVTRGYVTQGVSGADVNKDGWVDLFVTTITTKDSLKKIPRAINLFFLNNGDGTFRDVTSEFGLDQMNSFSTGSNWGDVNHDGYPDLYVGNYFLNYEGELTKITDATIVGANQTAKGYFLINEKGKYFSDAYKKYGFKHRGFGFGGVFTDFDNDHDLDLIVNHDFGYKAIPSFLYENEYPSNSFKDISETSEMDLKINAMGSAVGDFDEDGDMDYFITNIRFNRFMVNQGPDKPFEDQAKQLGTSYVSISWGANFADFDHDGDLDLFVANGDLNPNCVPMADYYFENQGGKFQEKARVIGVNDYGIGRGSVIFDIENDGDMDILVINQAPVLEGYPDSSMTTLYRNDSTSGNWLKVALKGNESDKYGLGARLELWIDGKKKIREIDGGGSSHISQNSVIAHFGVSTHTQADSLVVFWPGGKKQVVNAPVANQLIEVVEIPSPPKGMNWKFLFFVLGLAVFGYLAFRLKKINK